MTTDTPTSNDLIDDLVRGFFNAEPDTMASLARDDGEVRLRLPAGMTATTDPLDGVEVFMRHVLAACSRMRRSSGAVALVTERQAAAAGWPNARMANTAIALAWAYLVGADICGHAVPVLVEADEERQGIPSHLLALGDALPSYGELLTTLAPNGWHSGTALKRDDKERERSARAEEMTIGGKMARLDEMLHDWIGVDVNAVLLLSDRLAVRRTSGTARAAELLACIVAEAVRAARALRDEEILAVRVHTDRDASLAGMPGAIAANAALLLAVGICHGTGLLTAHLLPAATQFADALVEAGQRIVDDLGPDGDRQAQVLASFELRDLAARGYVHVGREAARAVARTLFDAMDNIAQARSTAGTAP